MVSVCDGALEGAFFSFAVDAHGGGLDCLCDLARAPSHVLGDLVDVEADGVERLRTGAIPFGRSSSNANRRNDAGFRRLTMFAIDTASVNRLNLNVLSN